MTETRRTLLARIRDLRDDDGWRQFHALYAPLLLRYALACGLSRAEAEEVRDQCLAVIAERMASFVYDPARGSFRRWVLRIAHGRIVDARRKRARQETRGGELEEFQDGGLTPEESFAATRRREMLELCVELALADASERDALVFRRFVLDGEVAANVGAALGVTVDQVYKARARVLEHVRVHAARMGLRDL